MNTVLLTAGVVALMAAVVGGGLKAFNIELPVLRSAGVRAALGALGLLFLIGAFVFRDDDGGGGGGGGTDPAVARYQAQVVAACNGVRANASHNSLGTPTPRVGPDGQPRISFDRDRVVSGLRTALASNRRRLKLVFDMPAPKSLRDEAKVAQQRYEDYARESRAFSSSVAREMPEDPTLQDIDSVTSPFQDRADAVIAPLEDAMTRLAGRECSLTSSDRSST